MKKLIIAFGLMVVTYLSCLVPSALAADIANGASLFSGNCASCHLNGKNIVNPTKTLAKSDLDKYEMFDLEKVKTQIINGKGAMPSFKAKFKAAEIEDIASFVLAQAEKGW